MDAAYFWTKPCKMSTVIEMQSFPAIHLNNKRNSLKQQSHCRIKFREINKLNKIIQQYLEKINCDRGLECFFGLKVTTSEINSWDYFNTLDWFIAINWVTYKSWNDTSRPARKMNNSDKKQASIFFYVCSLIS